MVKELPVPLMEIDKLFSSLSISTLVSFRILLPALFVFGRFRWFSLSPPRLTIP